MFGESTWLIRCRWRGRACFATSPWRVSASRILQWLCSQKERLGRCRTRRRRDSRSILTPTCTRFILNDISYIQLTKRIEKDYGQRKKLDMLGPLHCEGKPCATLRRTLSKPHEEVSYIGAIQGHSGGAAQPNSFTQEILTNNCTEELHHIRYTKFEDAIKG